MLSAKQQKIALIAAYTAISDTPKLTQSLDEGLDAGLSINQIKEIFLQMNLYCGFPRGIRGVDIFMGVLEERKAKGVQDTDGPASSAYSGTRSRYERGEEVHLRITGLSAEALKFGAMGFIPKIDVQLKEYIFADAYESDLLSYADREIATVSAILTMNDLEPQAQFHINTALQVGLSEQEINQLIVLLENEFGKAKGDTGRKLLANVIAARINK